MCVEMEMRSASHRLPASVVMSPRTLAELLNLVRLNFGQGSCKRRRSKVGGSGALERRSPSESQSQSQLVSKGVKALQNGSLWGRNENLNGLCYLTKVLHAILRTQHSDRETLTDCTLCVRSGPIFFPTWITGKAAVLHGCHNACGPLPFCARFLSIRSAKVMFLPSCVSR